MDSEFKSFAAALADDYRSMALINFAMEYYNAYEMLYGSTEELREEDRSCIKRMLPAAEKLFEADVNNNEVYAGLSELRSEIIDRMEMLSACTDYFAIHEYILNRIELRYGEELPPTDNDEEARKLLQFIFEPKDNVEVNLRIRSMLACMPVRMTGSRFFDLLQESFTVYKGSEKNSLDSHVYMIRSAAGLGTEGKELPAEIKKYFDIFENIDYKGITEASYEEYSSLLSEISDILTARTELVMSLMEVLNDLAAAYITADYASDNEKLLETIKPCTEMVSRAFETLLKTEDYTELDSAVSDECFSRLEGHMEKLSGKISASEGRLDSFKGNVSADETAEYDSLICAGKLMSGSEFVKLDEGIDITECSDETVNAAFERLAAELKAVFDRKDRTYRRAVMASVLKELPVFFVSHTEVMNYIRFTLDNCKDEAEKTASLRLFSLSFEEK